MHTLTLKDSKIEESRQRKSLKCYFFFFLWDKSLGNILPLQQVSLPSLSLCSRDRPQRGLWFLTRGSEASYQRALIHLPW